ncbi:hypothetical protein ACFQ3S_19640 [Mucilaginibacter terrae]|uniref:hypothetical protein n=1 Tax=Mucilaginibacter terrae TaxID=1955052 RepID=UPI00362F4786
MRKTYQLLAIFTCLLLALGCRKDLYTGSNESSPVEKANDFRTLFYSRGHNKMLVQKLNDSLNIKWEVNWDSYKQSNIADSLTYYYFDLNPKTFNKETFKEDKPIQEVDYKKFLIVGKTPTQTFFRIATYYFDNEYKAENKKTRAIGKNYKLKNFSGRVLYQNLDLHTNNVSIYKNGVKTSSTASSKTASQAKKVNGWQLECKTEHYCVYTSQCPNEGYYIVEVRSENICSFFPPYYISSYCSRPLQEWYLQESNSYEICQNVWYPDPPADPGDNPGGGGGGDGGGDDNSGNSAAVNALQHEINIKEDFLIDCDSLTLLAYNGYGGMYQQVAQFTPSQTIKNRIEYLQTFTGLNFSTFNVQNLDDAYGTVVNSDFFPVRISQMPTGMTASNLTEYFRTHLNDFITTGEHFTPYRYGDIDDTDWFNQPGAASVGALVHIELLNNGTVIESDYQIDANAASFKFTTMTSPLDVNHPVSGNREFGVYADPRPGHAGHFTFYTMGVDRASDWMFHYGNEALGGFKAADKLWSNMQEQMINYINSHGGQAGFYDNKHTIARPDWDAVKEYLQGDIDLATLKQKLGC